MTRVVEHFGFPCRRPCDYQAICCTNGKTIQCLPNPSQHISIVGRQFPSYSNRKCKKYVPQPTFLFPLEAPLRLSCNMLHGWKDNSMIAKPLAAYTHRRPTVSQLFELQVRRFHVCQPTFLPCDAIHSAAIDGMRFPFRLSVCPSVTFVNCAKKNKDILEIFSTCGSQAIIVFP